MNKILHTPTKRINNLESIEKFKINDSLILATTTGLKKEINEDSIGLFVNDKITRICITDGHWGEEASDIISKYWIEKSLIFPKNLTEAQNETSKIEDVLYQKFGEKVIDENKDFTPESSFICIEIEDGNISIVSYGDSRLFIMDKENIKFTQECKNTWLGVFSRLGLRGRLSVKEGVVFNVEKLNYGDSIFLFTDGVDQCIYEKDTISFDSIANLSKKLNIEDSVDSIFKEVFNFGAEDNASLVIYRY
jgi:serine/threonine protein phosphatase PrpC